MEAPGDGLINAQVVETSVTKNTSFQSYPHPNEQTIGTAKIVTLCAKMAFLKPLQSLFRSFSNARATSD